MRALVAYEESQAVTSEPCSGGPSEWHLQADALQLLKMQWDMILAFPPCTETDGLMKNTCILGKHE